MNNDTESGALGTTSTDETRDFFISYTHNDIGWAEWIAWMLEEAGYTTILQAWDFRPGSNFVLEMQRASSLAERTIAVVSPSYLQSRFGSAEWAAAFVRDPTGRQGRLLPVLVEKCDLRGLLPAIILIDLVDKKETMARKELLDGVKHARAKPSMKPRFPSGVQSSAPKRPRYPGPVSVKIDSPTVPVESWEREDIAWLALNAAVGGHPGFSPLTVKAAYVVGMIHDICGVVSYFGKMPESERAICLPAYGALCAAVKLLGHCVSGRLLTVDEDALRIGFKWLAAHDYEVIPDEHLLVRTGKAGYTIRELVELSQFAVCCHATHETAAPGGIPPEHNDRDLLGALQSLVAEGVDRYWNALQISEPLCNRLAAMDVIAFQQRFVLWKTWVLFERDALSRHHSITEIMNRFDWRA